MVTGQRRNLPEDEIFDIYIVSAIWALVASRGVEIAVRFNEFGWNIIRWFSVVFHSRLKRIGRAFNICQWFIWPG